MWLRVRHPPTAAALGDLKCLPGAGTAVMRVQDELLKPKAHGRLESKGVLLAPRNLGREIEIVDGSQMLVRPGPVRGTQKLTKQL